VLNAMRVARGPRGAPAAQFTDPRPAGAS
jgi:hypothetical protein